MAEPEVQTTVGGLRAIELYYRFIRDIASGQPAFLQTHTRLNSPGLGTIMPENFREVAEVTTQCNELFRLELLQALDAWQKFMDRELHFGWIAVYMPVRFLHEVGGDRTLSEICARYALPPSRICFALSDRLLEETDGTAAARILALRDLGFHLMLTGFGGNNCPMMRLADFPVDYVMLSPEVTHYIDKSERADSAVRSILGFVSDLGAEPIADGVLGSRQAELLFECGCQYCAGPLAGKYMAERYVRRKSDSDT